MTSPDPSRTDQSQPGVLARLFGQAPVPVARDPQATVDELHMEVAQAALMMLAAENLACSAMYSMQRSTNVAAGVVQRQPAAAQSVASSKDILDQQILTIQSRFSQRIIQ